MSNPGQDGDTRAKLELNFAVFIEDGCGANKAGCQSHRSHTHIPPSVRAR